MTGPYERLALRLAEVIHRGETPVEVGRRAGGRAVADAAVDAADGDPIGAVEQVMARNGFEPAVEQRGTEVDIVLRSCPFASAAAAMPDVVCELHHGIATGAAEQVGGVVVDELVAKDPRQAPCCLRLHLTD